MARDQDLTIDQWRRKYYDSLEDLEDAMAEGVILATISGGVGINTDTPEGLLDIWTTLYGSEELDQQNTASKYGAGSKDQWQSFTPSSDLFPRTFDVQIDSNQHILIQHTFLPRGLRGGSDGFRPPATLYHENQTKQYDCRYVEPLFGGPVGGNLNAVCF